LDPWVPARLLTSYATGQRLRFWFLLVLPATFSADSASPAVFATATITGFCLLDARHSITDSACCAAGSSRLHERFYRRFAPRVSAATCRLRRYRFWIRLPYRSCLRSALEFLPPITAASGAFRSALQVPALPAHALPPARARLAVTCRHCTVHLLPAARFLRLPTGFFTCRRSAVFRFLPACLPFLPACGFHHRTCLPAVFS